LPSCIRRYCEHFQQAHRGTGIFAWLRLIPNKVKASVRLFIGDFQFWPLWGAQTVYTVKVTREQWSLIAKYLSDMSKIIWAAGIASKFFSAFPEIQRNGLIAFGLILFGIAILITPKGVKDGDIHRP
jgi:hypothetical protein